MSAWSTPLRWVPVVLLVSAALGAAATPISTAPRPSLTPPDEGHEPHWPPFSLPAWQLTPPLPPLPPWYVALPPLTFLNINSQQHARVKLYDLDGRVDERAAEQLDVVLADARKPPPFPMARLDRRLLQLVFRTAYHFEATEVVVISAYRKPYRYREGMHGKARAMDFQLPGITPEQIASYLHAQPQVGVGLYTHPRTQFVHLDVREQSYHWVDRTPPGKRWGASTLRAFGLEANDARYDERLDLPEPPDAAP